MGGNAFLLLWFDRLRSRNFNKFRYAGLTAVGSGEEVDEANDAQEGVENGWGVDFFGLEFGGVEVVIHVVHGRGGSELDFEPLFESEFFAGG